MISIKPKPARLRFTDNIQLLMLYPYSAV